MPGRDFQITLGQVTVPTPVTITATLNGVSTTGQFTVLPTTLTVDLGHAARGQRRLPGRGLGEPARPGPRGRGRGEPLEQLSGRESSRRR